LLQLGVLPLDPDDDVVPFGDALSASLVALSSQRRAGIALVGAHRFAFAAERVALVKALFPEVALPLAPLPGDASVEREAAARQVVRGWVEVLGPTSAPELAARLGLGRADVEGALARIEAQGQVLRGAFRWAPATGAADDGGAEPEWCDRRLLQRIHRLTVGRLRRDIEPLSQQDFMRFLFRWQHVGPHATARGPRGVATVVARLEGLELPAAAWERDVLPVRLAQYVPEWLDHACFAGEVAWGRLTAREPRLVGPRRGDVSGLAGNELVAAARAPGLTRAASLTFALRGHLDWLLAAARPDEARLADGPGPWPLDLSAAARDVLAVLERRGASFFAELHVGSRRLPNEVEDALWELLARGLVTADAVQNLRVLQSPKLKRLQRAQQRGGPGRWTLLAPLERPEPDAVLEQVAQLFLRRWGIVFRDLVVREPLCPPWRELVQVYRRLETRGELRGGRFLHGFAGEQFALPEAVDLSRKTRRLPGSGEVVTVSAVDPLNLTGIVTPGPRVPATLGQVVRYVDGVATAAPAPERPAAG
ncbi:MAG: DEAD/DEAH box helicase, partial [Myxococcaceae bacterium]|nr:DEAD/DEAH box helicase [Myxococcaceae bacterium]